MRMAPAAISIAVAFFAAGCGSSPSSPSSAPVPTPSPTPAPSTFTMSGGISESAPTTTNKIPGAVVMVMDGANAGKSATADGAGNYSMTGLTAGTFTVGVSAAGYQSVSRSVTLSSNSTQNFTVNPNPATISDNFTGTISGGDATCSGGDGIFTTVPCKVITMQVHNAGQLTATLDWSPNRVADLDLSLFRGSTMIARSATATGGRESVSANLTAGFTYELHVTYYTGSAITTYTVAVSHPN
jgi:hypothetical protein